MCVDVVIWLTGGKEWPIAEQSAINNNQKNVLMFFADCCFSDR